MISRSGVRRGEDELKARSKTILDRRQADIDKILERFHVPRADRRRTGGRVRKQSFDIHSCCACSFGCEREERGFRVQPPDADRINSKQLSDLAAGTPVPPPARRERIREERLRDVRGQTAFRPDELHRLPCPRRRCDRTAVDGRKWIYGSQPEQIFSTIVEGRPNGMPSFHGKLPDYQIWQLAAYVRSLERPSARRMPRPGRDDDMQMKPPENSIPSKTPIRRARTRNERT